MLLVLTKGVSIVQGNDWKVWENSPFNCSQEVGLEWGLIVPKRLESWFLFDPTTFPIMWCASAVLLAGHVSRGKNDSRNIKSKSLPFLGLYEMLLLIEKIVMLHTFCLIMEVKKKNWSVWLAFENFLQQIMFPMVRRGGIRNLKLVADENSISSSMASLPHIFNPNPVPKLFSEEKLEKLQFSRLHFPTICN